MSVATLRTDRLTLRPVSEGDAGGLHAAYGDPAAMRFWDFPATADVEATAACIRSSLGVDPQWHGVWAIVAGGALAGLINYHHRETWNRRLELGWILAPAFWRKGYMTEAAGCVIRHCFEALDVHRIEAVIQPDNVASLRLAARLGFRREGLLHDRISVDGHHRSVVMHGLLKTEWRA